MKKYIFYIGILHVLILIFLFILIFNFNFFGNHPLLKSKIINYVKTTYNSTLNYEHIQLLPFRGELVLRNFYLENSKYSLSFSKAVTKISLVKLLKLNFMPSEIYFKDLHLKLPYFEKKEEEKPFDLESTLNYLYSLGPFSVIVKKGILEKETSYGSIKFNILRGETQIKERQIEVKVQSFLFLNFQRESFVREGVKKIEGKLEILGLAKGEDVFVEVSSLEMNFPNFYGKGNFQKNSQGYLFWLNLDRVNLLELKRMLSPLGAEYKTFKYVNELIKNGTVLNLSLKSSAKTFKELVSLSNLHLETELKDGEIEFKKFFLKLSKIEGKLFFEKAQLSFEGSALVNEYIPFQIEKFSLNLRKAPLELFLKTSFESEPQFLIDTARTIVKDLEFLRDYQLEGKIKGNLELSGNLANLKPLLNLNFYELKVKTPFYLKPLLIKNGILIYNSYSLDFKNLKLISENSWVESLEGSWDFKSRTLNLQANKVWLSKNFIEDLAEKSLKIKEISSKYNLTTDGVLLDWINYRGKISFESIKENPQVLLENLAFKGSMINFNLEIPYKEENFFLETQKFGFAYEKGKVILENSLFYIDQHPFEISGVYYSSFWSLKLKGEIKETFKSKILRLIGWDENLIFKGPVVLNNLEIEGFKDGLIFKGESVLSGKVLSFKGNYEKDSYTLESRFRGESSDLNFFFKKKEAYDLEIEGILELSEISSLLFHDQRFLEGKVRAQLRASFLEKNLEIMKKNLENRDFKELVQNYLISEFFPKMGFLEFEKFKYSEKENFFELSSQLLVYPSEIQLENLNFRWNNLILKGRINLLKENQFLHLKGFLESQKIDLRGGRGLELRSEKDEKFNWEEILKLPLIADLELNLKDIILPTAHLISESRAFLSLNSDKILNLKFPVLNICGLKIEGFYERNPQLQYLFIELSPSTGEFLDFFSCLYPEEMPKIILEGPFKTKGFFYTDGKETLLEDTYGELEVTSPRGYIYRAPLIARVLGFLSPIDIFRGKVPNLENNLLEYDELTLKAYFEDTSFKINEGFLSALGFRLFSSGSVSMVDRKTNLTFYISPFKTIDIIIEKIPFLSQRLLGKPRMLIFVPLQVVGTYDNPVIIPLHPSSIGKGIFTFLFRFLGIEEEFYKAPYTPEKLKKLEIFKEKVENNIRR